MTGTAVGSSRSEPSEEEMIQDRSWQSEEPSACTLADVEAMHYIQCSSYVKSVLIILAAVATGEESRFI
jgi:hypothetical protein